MTTATHPVEHMLDELDHEIEMLERVQDGIFRTSAFYPHLTVEEAQDIEFTIEQRRNMRALVQEEVLKRLGGQE
jgi:hypothetical protein